MYAIRLVLSPAFPFEVIMLRDVLVLVLVLLFAQSLASGSSSRRHVGILKRALPALESRQVCCGGGKGRREERGR